MSSAAGKYTDFTAHFSGFRLEGLPRLSRADIDSLG
jgi:hypothetical protein